MAAMTNIFHLRNAGLRTSVWFVWAPSDANVSDVPSRPDDDEGRELLRRINAKTTRMRYPSPEDWSSPALILKKTRRIA